MLCTCGFSTKYPLCVGTHQVVKIVKDKIIEDIEKISLEENGSQLNALGMKMLVIDAIKKAKGV
jgi:CDGSH-type Zn-finger protein